MPELSGVRELLAGRHGAWQLDQVGLEEAGVEDCVKAPGPRDKFKARFEAWPHILHKGMAVI